MIKNTAHLNSIIARKTQKIVEPWAMTYWRGAPFTDKPLADAQTYMDLWQAAQAAQYPAIDKFEEEAGFRINPKWLHELALHTQVTIKESTICYQHGRVIYAALHNYLKDSGVKNPTILETGTARGFSATIMARVLEETGAGGKIVTLDLLPHETPIYWNCIDDHEGPKTRRKLLAPWKSVIESHIIFIEGDTHSTIGRLGLGRINFAFLDGAHEYKDVDFEFAATAHKQMAGDVIIFDDYNTKKFPGIVRAVDEGCERRNYSKRVIEGRDERHYVIATKR